jgi:hypothetical protein
LGLEKVFRIPGKEIEEIKKGNKTCPSVKEIETIS